MLLFDAHVHIGTPRIKQISAENESLPAYLAGIQNSISNYLKISRKNEVTKCLAFPFPFNEITNSVHNKYLLDCASQAPTLILPLLLPDSIEKISEKMDLIYGIKEHFYLNRCNQTVHNDLYDLLQQTGKILLIHAHRDEWATRIRELGANFPDLKIIVAHCARRIPFTQEGAFENSKAIIKVHPRKENLFFETSTIRGDLNLLSGLIKLVGEDNILWGSDFPFYKSKNEDVYKQELDFVLNSAISEKARQKILEKNFRRLFQNEKIWVRHACSHDSDVLLKMLDGIDEREGKFLAINAKKQVIRCELQKMGHVFLAEDSNGIVLGFIRKSDRPKNGAVIEEIYVVPKARGMGVGKILMKSLIESCDYLEMKTYADNDPMVALAQYFGFNPKPTPKKTMIIWRLDN